MGVGTHRFPTSRGALKSATLKTPLVTMTLFPFVTRTTSRAPAHQFRLAPDPDSPPPADDPGSPSPPTAPMYGSSNTAPFFSAVPTSVCLRLKGSRGRVRGSEMMCAVSGDGWVCERHVSENVVAVVGSRAMRSYGENKFKFKNGHACRLHPSPSQ